MGQMFYSLSIAMGILITFGSYMKKDVSIEGSTKNVEIFDTAIAIMAGLMIIPAVFAFSGGCTGSRILLNFEGAAAAACAGAPLRRGAEEPGFFRAACV